MRTAIRFGASSIELEIPEDRVVALKAGPPRPPISELSLTLTAAVESPVDFPPLRQAVVPGDHVVIVLDERVPRPDVLLGPLARYLIDAGVVAGDICIIEVPPFGRPRNGLSGDGLPDGIALSQHDPHDRGALCYLATTHSGQRVYLNRNVVDADVVILVGRVEYHPILGYRGTASSVFPGLSDHATRWRFQSQISNSESVQSRNAARRETDEVGWLLGALFAVQVVVGTGNEVIELAAGACEAVQRRCQEVLDTAWRRRVARRAELVIAGISEDPADQGFEELGAALATACGLVRQGGQVVLLSETHAPLSPSLEAARKFGELAELLKHLRLHPRAGDIGTYRIARACQQARIYLMSLLDSDLVEELFMTPIASDDEVQRLVSRAGSCLILNDAQLALTTLEGEDDEPIA